MVPKNAKNAVWIKTFEDTYFYPIGSLELGEVESFLCQKFPKSFAEERE